jgi:inositol-phosphate phosphatase / L-galactose 1-phosphate phosphatase / histidinol-phosphatase
VTSVSATDFLALAEQLADAAAEPARRYFRTALSIDSKEDLSPVTRADREAESAMRAILAANVPEHGIIGEEFGADRADAEWVWVLDPIDGTKSYVTGVPLFGVLVALVHRGRPVLGIIDQPILGERWIGAEGMASRFDGGAARTRACAALNDAWLNATTPHMFNDAEFARFEALRQCCREVRYGGDCYAYGLLANGHVDLVVEAGLKPYDFCALVPVITGAGGIVSDWQGAPMTIESTGQIVAAGDARMHEAALRVLS